MPILPKVQEPNWTTLSFTDSGISPFWIFYWPASNLETIEPLPYVSRLGFLVYLWELSMNPHPAYLKLFRMTKGHDRLGLSVLCINLTSRLALDALIESELQVAFWFTHACSAESVLEHLVNRGHQLVDIRYNENTSLAWPNESFDYVLSGELSDDLPNHAVSFLAQEVSRVLRSHGLVIASSNGKRQASQSFIDTLRNLRGSRTLHPILSLNQDLRPCVAAIEDDLMFIAEKASFLDRYYTAFHELKSISLKASQAYSRGKLRRLLAALSLQAGYELCSPNNSFQLIHRHRYEDRVIPLLLYYRTSNSPPLIQYTVRARNVELILFGPLRSDRRIPYISIVITEDRPSCIHEDQVADANIYTSVDDIPVGVHCAERLLRSAELSHHRPDLRLHVQQAYLRDMIHSASLRVKILSDLYRSLTPARLYVGHDCYDDAIDVSCALSCRLPVVLQPKGKLFHYYTCNDEPGKWSHDGQIYYSHLHLRFIKEVEKQWNHVTSSSLEESIALMNQRVNRIDALPYMKNVIYRDKHSDTYRGWLFYRDTLKIPLHVPDSNDLKQRTTWVFCLHSFSDEAFRWGCDGLWSLFSMYLKATQVVTELFPDDLIVLRPHPNSLAYLHSYEQIKDIEAGRLRGPTDLIDGFLQWKLCHDIRDSGPECRLSSLNSTAQLLSNHRTIVLSRHGSISLEAAWLYRPAVFSMTSPYSFIFPRTLAYKDEYSLRCAMVQARLFLDSPGPASALPSHLDIAKYQAVLNRPYGVQRMSFVGEVKMPSFSDVSSMGFYGFSYGEETISQAAERLMNGLSAPSETREFLRSLGCLCHEDFVARNAS